MIRRFRAFTVKPPPYPVIARFVTVHGGGMGFGHELREGARSAWEGADVPVVVPAQGGPVSCADGRFEATPYLRSEATRLLCQAVYARPDRIAALKAGWRRKRDTDGRHGRPRVSLRRRVLLEGDDVCPPLGEPMARWILDHVLHGPKWPVPSYGFDLVPVVAHSLRVRRHRRMRRVMLSVLVLAVACVFPRAAGVWAGAVLLASLIRRVASGTSGRARVVPPPWVAYFVLCVPWLLAVVPYRPVRDGVDALRGGLLMLPCVLLAGAVLLHTGDRLVARAALADIVRDGGGTRRPPRVTAKAGRRLAAIDKGQTGRELPYNEAGGFVGAGRDVWSAATIGVPLKPRHPDVPVKPFGEADLLWRIGEALSAPEYDTREITDPLPGFSVTEVFGLPAELWLRRARAGGPEPPDPRGGNRRSPSSAPERLYLRAQCVSWDGQVVVTVFAHAALEAGEVLLTLRPHVMTPLYSELRAAEECAAERGVRSAGRILAQALLDAVDGPRGVWRRVTRHPPPEEEPEDGRAGDKAPVSLRDRYSVEDITDLHQSDDAKRHVVLMQTCVFRAVSAYLQELGVDTDLYERQVATVINNIQVYGDNNAPIQAVAGNGNSNVGQGAPASTGGS